ncbi:MAG: hypothetical protein IID44_22280 [Planctomycetes bacterium]|nr:hypothetical protein [Planctomycetota bacterium]
MSIRRITSFLFASVLALSAWPAAGAEYIGPLRFQRQTFEVVRPVRLQIQRIPRENIRPAPIRLASIARERIAPPRLPRETIRHETFQFSRTIFGTIETGPPRGPGSRYVHPALRPKTRRRPLGW